MFISKKQLNRITSRLDTMEDTLQKLDRAFWGYWYPESGLKWQLDNAKEEVRVLTAKLCALTQYLGIEYQEVKKHGKYVSSKKPK